MTSKPCPRGHSYFGTKRETKTLADGTTKIYVVRKCLICDRARKRRGGQNYWQRARAATHCKRGHAFEGENLAIETRQRWGKEREQRRCATCKRIAGTAWARKHRMLLREQKEIHP